MPAFSLLEFGIGAPLQNVKLTNLRNILNDLIVELRDLSIDLDNPPLLLADFFEHDVTSGEGIRPGEVGEYVNISYKSVFVYAKLDRPLITLEFATISGIRLGLSFNSKVTSSTMHEISDFLFINDHSMSSVGKDQMKLLKSLMSPRLGGNWVVLKSDSFWLAAGMTVKVFDTIDVTAVAMIAFQDSGPTSSLFADAVVQMSPDMPDRVVAIVYAEILCFVSGGTN